MPFHNHYLAHNPKSKVDKNTTHLSGTIRKNMKNKTKHENKKLKKMTGFLALFYI